jgi:hypothetical protein
LLVVCFRPVTSISQGTLHSLSLNGTSGYVSVPNSASINISGPITIEAWIKLNASTGDYRDIVCREAWGQAGTGGGYEFAITNSGKVRLDLYQSHNQYTTAIGVTTVTANAWHHVAGVFDGSQIRVYLDGVLDGSVSTTNGPASGTSVLNIGKSTYTTYYFAGLIDEVRLSAAALYSGNFSPGLGPGSNTRGLWRFDGQTVLTIVNLDKWSTSTVVVHLILMGPSQAIIGTLVTGHHPTQQTPLTHIKYQDCSPSR